jgi:hypothetical protein
MPTHSFSLIRTKAVIIKTDNLVNAAVDSSITVALFSLHFQDTTVFWFSPRKLFLSASPGVILLSQLSGADKPQTPSWDL